MSLASLHSNEALMCDTCCVQSHVGGKSMSLASLRSKLSDTVAVPSSVALPFGSFERTLSHRSNTSAARQIAALQKQLVRFPQADFNRFRHTSTIRTSRCIVSQQQTCHQADCGDVEATGTLPHSATVSGSVVPCLWLCASNRSNTTAAREIAALQKQPVCRLTMAQQCHAAGYMYMIAATHLPSDKSQHSIGS